MRTAAAIALGLALSTAAVLPANAQNNQNRPTVNQLVAQDEARTDKRQADGRSNAQVRVSTLSTVREMLAGSWTKGDGFQTGTEGSCRCVRPHGALRQ